jgi:hypothetical protein
MSSSYSDFVDLADVTLTPSYESSAVHAVAIVNGYSCPIVSAQVELNAHGFTNSASVVLPIEGNPDFSIVLGDAATPTSGNDSPSVYFELWYGIFDTPQDGSLDTAGMVRIFLGVIENYEARVNEGVVTFSLRSIAADLADTKITKLTMSEPASTQFLSEQSVRAGLNYEAPSPALKTPITIQQVLGKEFIGGSNFNATVYRKSAADLLIQAATFDDCDVWIEDDTIYYQQARNVQRGAPINLVHGRDFAMEGGVILSHALRQSNNIRVDVHSFQPLTRISTRTRLQIDPVTLAVTKTTGSVMMTRTSIPLLSSPGTTTITQGPSSTTYSTATSSGGAAVGSSGIAPDQTSVEKYAFYVPNQDQATCNRLATAIARQIASLEYRLTFTIPMKKALVSQLRIISAFNISGLPYDRWNDVFYARRITYDISTEVGVRVTVDAVNHALLQGELD